MTRLKLAAWLALGFATVADAQTGTPTTTAPTPPPITLADEAAKDGVFTFDWGVPTSPALALAGLSQDKATVQSSALKPFVLSLPSVISGPGGQSAALDMSPAWLFEGEGDRSYRRYVDPGSFVYRLLYRTRINAALYNGTSDKVEAKKQKGSRLAFGLSMSLLDSSDPLMAGSGGGKPSVWQACLGEQESVIREMMRYQTALGQQFFSLADIARDLQVASYAARTGARPDERLIGRVEQLLGAPISLDGLSDADAAARLLELSREVGKQAEAASIANNQDLLSQAARLGLDKSLAICADRANNAAIHGTSLSLGGGALWRGEPGDLDHFKRGGAAAWLSFRFPLGFAMAPDSKVLRYLMIGAYARRGFGEYVATGDSALPEMRAHSWDYWVGLEHLTQTSKLAVQYGRTEIRADDPANDRFSKSRSRYLMSAAFPLLGKETGLWLGVAYGNARSTVATESDRTFLITLEFAPPKAADIFKLKG
jgi:hypothetical protein